jgi:hypothetical protein
MRDQLLGLLVELWITLLALSGQASRVAQVPRQAAVSANQGSSKRET